MNVHAVKSLQAGLLLLLLTLSACVTVNIYFPAAEAEQAARTIVREVLQEDSANRPAAEPQSAAPQRWLLAMLNLLVPEVTAAEQPDIRIDTPAIRKLRDSMRSRGSSLQPHCQSGAVGFQNDGLVVVRDLAAVSLRDRNSVRQLVDAENQDRTALYRELARANGHPEWQPQIQGIFARVWLDEAPVGFWVQATDGSWQKK